LVEDLTGKLKASFKEWCQPLGAADDSSLWAV